MTALIQLGLYRCRVCVCSHVLIATRFPVGHCVSDIDRQPEPARREVAVAFGNIGPNDADDGGDVIVCDCANVLLFMRPHSLLLMWVLASVCVCVNVCCLVSMCVRGQTPKCGALCCWPFRVLLTLCCRVLLLLSTGRCGCV